MNKKEILETLKSHLQIAIELEHSTLPPYLYACWSIQGNSPQAKEATQLLLSVIREEMLHMAMACNILNAIGGSPSINHDEFVPSYPGYLPGHSHTANAFTVHLEKFSTSAIDTFMKIELPARFTENPEHGKRWATIGEFYEEIIELINSPELTDEDFRGGKQIDNSAYPAHGKLFTVNSKQDAIDAVDEIIDQGEGLEGNEFDAEHELTHFFRFKKASDLMTSKSWDWPNEVLPVATDPEDHYFPDEAKEINRQFNAVYSGLLDEMHDAFNKEGGTMDKAIDIMFELIPLAKKLMTIPMKTKVGNCGPTFIYVKPEFVKK